MVSIYGRLGWEGDIPYSESSSCLQFSHACRRLDKGHRGIGAEQPSSDPPDLQIVSLE